MPTVGRVACGVLAAAVAVHVLIDGVALGPTSLYQVVSVASLGLAWAALLRAGPQRPWAWRWLLAGFSLWVLGDILWEVETGVLGLAMFPAWSDALYLVGYVQLSVGALLLARSRQGGRDPTAVLDAAIVAVGAAVPTWVFLVAPAAADSGLSLAGKLVASAYPLLDLFLLAVLARLLATPGARTGAYRSLVWALLTTMAADAGWNAGVVLVGADFQSRWTDGLWLVSYVLVAWASTHPSMVAVTEPPPGQARPPSRSRLAALALAATLPGATLAADGWDGDAVSWEAAALGSALLSLLVLSRMAGLLEQVQVQAVQLSALARTDGLTGIPNRRTWDHELSRACAGARDSGLPLAVALLDLDRFKRFNDEHGHQAGDRLLREAAAAWTAELEPAGGLLARYGGEEFAVLLPGLSSEAACAVLDRLRRSTPGGQAFSAGVAVWDPATEPSAVVGAADTALYEAKRLGRDRVVAASGTPGAGALPAWADAVRVGLRPVVRSPDGGLVGHEASARFPHDEDVRRVLARAREEGYGDLLQAHLLRRALSSPDRPSSAALFVHVSTEAVASRRFWAAVPDDLSGVVLELGEDRATTPAGRDDRLPPEEWAELLRGRGGALAVQEVAGRRSPLGLVLAVRPDVVTLDRHLVAGCAEDPARLLLVDLVVRLAGSTGAQVCARGVRDAADLAALRARGVHTVQGSHVGPRAPGRTAVTGQGRPAPAARPDGPGYSPRPAAVPVSGSPSAS